MSVSYILDFRDIDALLKLLDKKQSGRVYLITRAFPIFACFLALVSLLNFFNGSSYYKSWMGSYGDVIFYSCLALLMPLIQAYNQFHFLRNPNRGVQEQIILSQDGVLRYDPEPDFTYWTDIVSVEETKAHYFLLKEKTMEQDAYIVPKRAFDSPASSDAFVNFARDCWHKTHPA